MLNKDCHHDCNQSYCPFAQDNNNANRYVCLKCGTEREINRYSSGFGSFLMLLLSLFIAFQLLVTYERQNNQPQQESPISSQS
ncbi:hypothetical protein [Anabaena subtropica]|uniref:Uncharacterized protein n=1 Tax=Anabaena subtropica FACHB-260 TaxID=2692884 RepID=A0ABR8CHU7_9NOST|nr:hypothetical protein [Anabaena subtropica]MBD2342772.1 hypothetical protein [Anabaena subtropica FACHB-260]